MLSALRILLVCILMYINVTYRFFKYAILLWVNGNSIYNMIMSSLDVFPKVWKSLKKVNAPQGTKNVFDR